MTVDRDAERLFRKLDHYGTLLPSPIGRALHWLCRGASPWVRIPLAVLLMAGSVFSFLPVLGMWMMPLGLLLLAIDVPGLQRPTLGALVRAERAWLRWQRKRKRARTQDGDGPPAAGPSSDATGRSPGSVAGHPAAAPMKPPARGE